MAGFSGWIKKAVDSLVDPEKEQRLAVLVHTIQHGLSAKKQAFSLAEAIQGIDAKPTDLEQAKEHVYRTLMDRGWKDGMLTESEQSTAKWVAQRLEMTPAQVKSINLEFAKNHFARALAQAMDDGVLDDDEVARLNAIAAAVGQTTGDFVRTFYFSVGEGFLRGMFLACVSDNRLSRDEWHRLLTTTERLGLSKGEMLDAIQPQARQFVEHVLADAKADGRLSEQEENVLAGLLNNLRLPDDFHRYVKTEIALLRQLTDITDGKLPSLPRPDDVEIRAGEIVHFLSRANWRRTRMLRSGPQQEDHRGVLVLTDNRLIFASGTKSESLSYRKIVSHRGGLDRIEAQVEGKPANTYFFAEESPLPYAVFRSAIAMANQTLVRKSEAAADTRHIPRDVRQRAWQRFGGRCAECGAEDYLEFDHIIPVAKGGSNSDANIQLLCRRCNLKKSDRI